MPYPDDHHGAPAQHLQALRLWRAKLTGAGEIGVPPVDVTSQKSEHEAIVSEIREALVWLFRSTPLEREIDADDSDVVQNTDLPFVLQHISFFYDGLGHVRDLTNTESLARDLVGIIDEWAQSFCFPFAMDSRRDVEVDGLRYFDPARHLDDVAATALVARLGFELDAKDYESIDVAGAEILAGWSPIQKSRKHTIHGIHILQLSGLRSIDEASCEALCRWPQGYHPCDKMVLQLDGLRALSDACASHLLEWVGGDSGHRELSMNGIEAVERLPFSGRHAEHSGSGTLRLGGVKTLSESAAAKLGGWRGGGLILDGLTSIESVVVSKLARWTGTALSLNGLNTLDLDAASELSTWASEGEGNAARAGRRLRRTGVATANRKLCLNGITEMSSNVASAVAGWEGDILELNGLRRWDGGVSAILGGRSRRKLSLSGIEEMTRHDCVELVAVNAWDRNSKSQQVCLHGVTRLDAVAALMLGHIPGIRMDRFRNVSDKAVILALACGSEVPVCGGKAKGAVKRARECGAMCKNSHMMLAKPFDELREVISGAMGVEHAMHLRAIGASVAEYMAEASEYSGTKDDAENALCRWSEYDSSDVGIYEYRAHLAIQRGDSDGAREHAIRAFASRSECQPGGGEVYLEEPVEYALQLPSRWSWLLLKLLAEGHLEMPDEESLRGLSRLRAIPIRDRYMLLARLSAGRVLALAGGAFRKSAGKVWGATFNHSKKFRREGVTGTIRLQALAYLALAGGTMHGIDSEVWSARLQQSALELMRLHKGLEWWFGSAVRSLEQDVNEGSIREFLGKFRVRLCC